MLSELRAEFVLACLSNTNESHWGEMVDRCGLCELLDRQAITDLLHDHCSFLDANQPARVAAWVSRAPRA